MVTGESAGPHWPPRITVVVVVCPQVQSGARSDLEKPYRQIEFTIRCGSSPPISAADRPTSLVCGGASSAARNESAWSAAVEQDLGPGGIGVPGAAGAGIPAAQSSVPGRRAPSGAGRRAAAAAPRGVTNRLRGRTESPRRRRRLRRRWPPSSNSSSYIGEPEAAAEPPLRPQGVHQVIDAVFHAFSPFSPAPTTSNAFPNASGSGTDSSLSQCS